MKKNFILYGRRWRSTVTQMLVPAIFALLLLGLARAVKSPAPTLNPANTPIAAIPQCVIGAGLSSCNTLLWVSNSSLITSDVQSIINFISADNNIPAGQITQVNSEAQLKDIWKNTRNESVAAVVFYSASRTAGVPYAYNLYLNTSSELGPLLANYQLAIDNAIIKFQANGALSANPLSVGIRGYPSLPSLLDSELITFNAYGALFFFVAIFFQFFVILGNVVAEKETNLRLGMNMMGLRDAVFWFSWFLTSVVLNAFAALIVTVVGYIIGFDFFTNANFGIVFAMFFLFGVSMTPFAFFVSTFLSSTKTASTVGFTILVIGVLFQFIAANSFAIYSWWDPGVTAVPRWIFVFYAPFNFAKIFADINRMASRRLNSATGKYEAGPGFWSSDLYEFKSRDGDLISKTVAANVAPTTDAFWFLVMDFFVFYVLTWYLDGVLGGTGVKRSPFFIFSAEFWGCAQPKAAQAHEMTPMVRQDDDPDVIAEAQRTHARSPKADDPEVAVQILRLVKDFTGVSFGKKKKDAKPAARRVDSQGNAVDEPQQTEEDHHEPVTAEEKARAAKGIKRAVDNTSMTIAPSSCLAMLGHNGAGKTTTISMLVGLYPPTSGDAFVFGKSIRENMSDIRKIMGVCPQHDILWPDLTAREHLRMFCEFKGIEESKIEAEVDRCLKDVNLFDVGDKEAGTYSGGMKRRLSVAISCVGSPRIIFLDEPTTGMDPASRRQVWGLIHQMKKGRVVLLTTHSMEEADALSDRICIMGGGRIRCIGDSLRLKSRYGKGYNINLVCDAARVKEVRALVAQHLPVATLLADNAGNLMYNYAPEQDAQNNLPAFIGVLEDLPSDLLRDFGVSQTTLEEVFLRVTKETNYAAFSNGSSQNLSSSATPASPTSAPGSPIVQVGASGQPMMVVEMNGQQMVVEVFQNEAGQWQVKPGCTPVPYVPPQQQ